MTAQGLMFDSITPDLIPGWAQLRALYVNGAYGQHPRYGAGRIYIDVLGTAPHLAGILDVERGNATPAGVSRWLMLRAAFDVGVIYCDRSTLPAVSRAAGEMAFNVWLATLDGTIPDGIDGPGHLVAVQAYPAAMTGCNMDISVVVDPAWWHRHALLARPAIATAQP